MLTLRTLYPGEGKTTADQATSSLLNKRDPKRELPYLALNMVSSIDGRATVQGRSGALGNEADREIFLWLRAQVDAVLIGSGTLRAEPYGRIIKEDAMFDHRIKSGLERTPLACVITRTLELNFDIPLFHDSESKVVLFTSAAHDPPACAAELEVVRMSDEQLTPKSVLQHLRANNQVLTVLCEGGPHLNGSLLAAGLVDELHLTISAKLVGGFEFAIVSKTELPQIINAKLDHLLEQNGYLFARYQFSS